MQLEKALLNEERLKEVDILKVQIEEFEREVEREKIRYETKMVEMETKVVEYRDRYVVAEQDKMQAE